MLRDKNTIIYMKSVNVRWRNRDRLLTWSFVVPSGSSSEEGSSRLLLGTAWHTATCRGNYSSPRYYEIFLNEILCFCH